jgi:hypothetical protein
MYKLPAAAGSNNNTEKVTGCSRTVKPTTCIKISGTYFISNLSHRGFRSHHEKMSEHRIFPVSFI